MYSRNLPEYALPKQLLGILYGKHGSLMPSNTRHYSVLGKIPIKYKLFVAAGALLFVGGVVMSLSSRSNNQQAEEIAQATEALAAELGGDDGDPTTPQPAVIVPVAQESDNSTRQDVLDHSTPADQPKRIEINGINVFARVSPVGVNTKGQVGVPVNVFDASWYTGSSKVGQSPGASVIVGHAGYRSVHGVFYSLSRLKAGDIVKIVMGDNTEHTYRVDSSKKVSLNDFSMSNYLSFKDSNVSRLHLITCTGSVIPGSTSYDSRHVVSATLL